MTNQEGDYIKLMRDIVPWYSGYGSNPHHILRAGEIGRVTHVDLIPITGRARRGVLIARFPGGWQAEISTADFERVEHSPLCYSTVCHISCPIGD